MNTFKFFTRLNIYVGHYDFNVGNFSFRIMGVEVSSVEIDSR